MGRQSETRQDKGQEEQEETCDTLFPLLQERRAGWLNVIEQIRLDYPGEDLGDTENSIINMVNKWLWLIPVAEAMYARPELRSFRPLLSHASIRLPYGEGALWIDATADNYFKVQREVCQENRRHEFTPLCEGDAEQTAACVAAFLQKFANSV